MANFLLNEISQRVAPNQELSALISIATLSDDEALEVWTQWSQQHDLDDINWQVHKVLARIASRIAYIAPHCHYRPRVEGLAKAHWTHSQLMLRASRQGLACLVDASIPVMLMKGAAFSLSDSSVQKMHSEGAHVMSDLDVMVPRMLYSKAIHVLYEAGWRCKESVEMSAERWRYSPGTNVYKSPHGDLDVHHQPMHGKYLSQAVLNQCWLRAPVINYHGLPVRIPALADQIVFTASHAAFKSSIQDSSASWVFDLRQLLVHSDIEADDLLASACEFDQLLAVRACINYLISIEPTQKLHHLLSVLMEPTMSVASYVEFYCYTLNPNVRMIAQQLSRYSYLIKATEKKSSKKLTNISSISYCGEYKWDVIKKLKPSNKKPKLGLKYEISQQQRVNKHRHEIVLQLPEEIKYSKKLSCYFEIECVVNYAGRCKFDIAINHHACARLNCDMSIIKDSQIIGFEVPIESDIKTFTIEAITRHTLTTQTKASQRNEWQALTFNVQKIIIY